MAERIPRGLNTWETAVVSRFFGTRGKLLDIGCGTGREAFALHDLGFEVTGIDISEGQLAEARNVAAASGRYVTFALCDGLTLDFPDLSFDYVVIWSQAMGNVPDQSSRIGLLQECKRVLRPGGLLSFSGHSLEHCAANHVDCVDGADFYPFGRQSCKWHLFTLQEFRGLCAQAGLCAIECCDSVSLGWDQVVLVCVCKLL